MVLYLEKGKKKKERNVFDGRLHFVRLHHAVESVCPDHWVVKDSEVLL